MFHFVYQTTNTVNGKIYIGKHSTDDIDDGYLGSGKLLAWAIEKYGPEFFVREILAQFETEKQALEFEREIVTLEFIELPNNYNLIEGGNAKYGMNRAKCDVVCDGITYPNRHAMAKEYPDFNRFNFIANYKNGLYRFVNDDMHNETLVNYEKLYNAERERLKKWNEESLVNIKTAASKIITEYNKSEAKKARNVEVHTGRKRPASTRKKLSDSKKKFIARNGTTFLGKGCVYATDNETGELKRFSSDELIPENFTRGNGSNTTAGRRWYNKDGVNKLLFETEVPEGFELGMIKCKS